MAATCSHGAEKPWEMGIEIAIRKTNGRKRKSRRTSVRIRTPAMASPAAVVAIKEPASGHVSQLTEHPASTTPRLAVSFKTDPKGGDGRCVEDGSVTSGSCVRGRGLAKWTAQHQGYHKHNKGSQNAGGDDAPAFPAVAGKYRVVTLEK